MHELLHRIRDGLRRGAYVNERAVSTSIVVPLLRLLGWDDSDPDQVMPEHVTGRGRVDYALRCPPQPPVAFIEVKGVGRSNDADRQLFEYAFHEGVPLAVLTDGREWNFYLPAQQGSYTERRTYQLVLDERDVSESEERLRRYLQRDRLASGAALEAATADYRDARSRREAADTLPKAWAELLAEPDPLLLEAVLERTEALCGFRPSDEQAARFLQGQLPPGVTVPQTVNRSTRHRQDDPAQRLRAEETTALPSQGAEMNRPALRHSWAVGDQTGRSHKAVDAFIDYLDALFARAPDRRQHVIAAARTRSRNNIAADLADVYPKQPRIAVRAHRGLANGLYVGTNLSNANKVQLARQTAPAAGLTYGAEAVLELAK